MDSKNYFVSVIASFILVVRRLILLIFKPYETMRKISLDKDYVQSGTILFLVLLYFWVSTLIRKSMMHFIFIYLIFLFNFIWTVIFFFLLGKISKKQISLKSYFLTLSYSLLPTLIWFIANSLFYHYLPPPRTASLQGRLFSILFIAFSLSILLWKVILVYLGVRFSSKQNFYRVVYHIILYCLYLIPFSYLCYHFKIFRIPFI